MPKMPMSLMCCIVCMAVAPQAFVYLCMLTHDVHALRTECEDNAACEAGLPTKRAVTTP